MTLNKALESVKPTSSDSETQCHLKWDSIVKPLKSLGEFEKIIGKIASIQRSTNIDISRRALVVMCADNGVVSEGISQSDSSVTTTVAKNLASGGTSVSVMASHIGADVIPVDIGINQNLNIDGLLNKKIMLGTNNFCTSPAMSKLEATKAIETGINLVLELKEKGYNLIATGEMGIGNTTTSSALASVLLGKSVLEVTGRGAGLDDCGLSRKVKAIETALSFNSPDPNDMIDCLSKVGGLDIAGMVGLFIGGAAADVPIIIDGFISGIAAIIAGRLCPLSKEYMIQSHISAEPAGALVLEELGLSPIISAGLCLGEGTGGIMAIGMIDMAVKVYNQAFTFEQSSMEQYTPLS